MLSFSRLGNRIFSVHTDFTARCFVPPNAELAALSFIVGESCESEPPEIRTFSRKSEHDPNTAKLTPPAGKLFSKSLIF